MIWDLILKHWKAAAMLLTILTLGTTCLVYRGEADHWMDKYDQSQRQLGAVVHVLNKQNDSIRAQGLAQKQVEDQLDTAQDANASLQQQLATALKKNATAPIGPTCNDAMEYLRSQAPSLVPPASTAVPPAQ